MDFVVGMVGNCPSPKICAVDNEHISSNNTFRSEISEGVTCFLRKQYNDLEAVLTSQQQSQKSALTETWLNADDAPKYFALLNYKLFNKPRDIFEGRVMIQCFNYVSVAEKLDSVSRMRAPKGLLPW